MTGELTPLRIATMIAKRYGFTVDDETPTLVDLTARGRGNGTDCEPDPAVIAKARQVLAEIRLNASSINAAASTLDEWVCITLTTKEHKS